ncbi:MAG: sensor histidine kinase, partial [Paraclostridium sp.]
MKKISIFKKKNLFTKMLLIYSTITVIAIYLLTTIFLKYYVDNEIQNELNIHSELIFNIEKRFEEQNIVSNSVINGINTQKHITDEISILISSTYEDYISYKLDKFVASNTKQADLDYVLSTILSGREDALAVIINDKNREYVSEIVLKHDRWYKFKNKIKSRYVRKITKPIKNVDSEYILGYIDIYFDLTSINDLINSSNLEGKVLISDESNNIIFDSKKELSPWDINELSEKYDYIYNLENKSIHIDKEIINISQDAQTKYKYISIINEEDIGISNIRFKIFSISILCIIIIIMITSLVINSYSIKLKQMIRGIGEIKNGNLSVRFNIEKEEDELDVIAKEIDRMCENLEYHIDKTYKSEVRQKEAELNALQAQIKPHFLYNTLEVIRMCALSSKNKEVAQMIYNLASMFRYQTYNNASDVLLSEMINYCKMYLSLCCTRYKGIVSYEF